MDDKSIRNLYTGLLGLGLLIIIVGAASVYFIQASLPGTVITANGSEIRSNTITVTGTGTITMTPDEGIVYLGVQTQSTDAVTAQQDNALTMERIIEALEAAGIAQDDMETSGYTMYPMRDYQKPEPTITGYVVSNQLKVTVKDIDSVGNVIDTAVDAGANEVTSVSFTLSEQTRQSARQEALETAVKAARSDADALADTIGVSITGPLQITTSGGGITIEVPESEVAFERGAATPIQPGEVSVTAFVQVTYTFK